MAVLRKMGQGEESLGWLGWIRRFYRDVVGAFRHGWVVESNGFNVALLRRSYNALRLYCVAFQQDGYIKTTVCDSALAVLRKMGQGEESLGWLGWIRRFYRNVVGAFRRGR